MKQETTNNPLSEAIGYQLKRATALLRTRMDKALRPLGLTVPQYACLELLGQQPGLSNADLARGAFVTRQSMNLVLRGLQDRGLVQRPESVDQGRARPSQLTGTGREVLERASASIAEVERQMLAGLSEGEIHGIRNALSRCSTNLK